MVLGLVIITHSVGFQSDDSFAATSNKCDGAAGNDQNNLNVTAKHGSVFYIDSGQGQNIDAAYVSYVIKNTSSASDKTGLWAKIDTFTGGVVSLANPNDATMPLGTVAKGNDSATAFFLLKATASSSSAQSHVLRVFSGKPGLAGSTEVYSCTFTFSKVAETIKAAANKVTNITNTSVTTLGSTMTVTVTGSTGTVGAGSTADPGILWFSPAARSSWPTGAYRLTGTSISVVGQGNKAAGTYTDTLKVTLAELQSTTGNSNTKQFDYTAVYSFQVVGPSPSGATVLPIGQIASGTQIKHSDVSATGSTASLSASTPTVNLGVTKTVGNTATVAGGNTTFSYTVTMTNSGSTDVTIDQVTDTPAPGLSYVANSVRFSSASTTEPSRSSTDSTKLIFPGPYLIPANSSRTITYNMAVTTCVTSTYDYTNTAVASVGSLSIGSSPSTMSYTSAQGTCGQTTVTATTTTQQLPIEAVTGTAQVTGNTTATISGSIDPNGDTGSAMVFQYGTSPTLSSATSISIGNTAGGTGSVNYTSNLSGLNSGTVYYYRIKGGNVNGAILSFVTTEPVSNPTATTGTVTNLTLSSGKIDVTLNGSIDPNQVTNGAKVKFEYASSNGTNSCTSLGTTVPVPGSGYLQDGGADILLAGAFPTDVNTVDSGTGNTVVTGLTNNSWYCFRVIAYYSTSYATAASGAWVPFQALVKTNQTITFSGPGTLQNGTNWTISGSTTSGLTVNYASNTPDVCIISGGQIVTLSQGTCSITASQDGSTTFYAAEPVTITFPVTAGAPYITNIELLSGTVNSSYSELLIAVDGNGVYSNYTKASGDLPPGIYLNASTGALTGTPTTAGTYTASYTVVSNSQTSQTKTLTIVVSKKPQTITVSNKNKTYGDTASFAAGGVASSGQNVSYTSSNNQVVSVNGTDLVIRGAGTATVTASASGNSEFNAAPDVNFTVTIAKAPLTITGNSYSVEYGTSTFTYGKSISGFVYSDTESDLTSPISCTSTYTSLTNAGSTPQVACSGAASTNYSFNYVPGTVTVTKKDLDVSGLVHSSVEYGSSVPSLAPQYSGFVNGQGVVNLGASLPTCSTAYTPNTHVNSIPVAITCSGGTATNYNYVYHPGSITVVQKPITVSPPTVSVQYGDPLPSIGSPTFSPLANGETSSVFDVLPSCNASGYSVTTNVNETISVTCANGSDGDYSFSYTSRNVNITQRPITIESKVIDLTYGDPIPSGTDLAPDFSGFVNGQNESVLSTPASCVTTYQRTSNVGSNPSISCSNASATNYSFSYLPSYVNISKKQLNVSAPNHVLTYGDPVPSLSPIISGFVNGQNSSALSVQPQCQTSYSPTTSASQTPTISCSGANATNYSFAYVNGVATINKKGLTVTGPSRFVTYGDAVPSLTPTISGFVNSENESNLATAPSCTTVYTNTTGASNTPVPIVCANNGVSNNYSFSYSNGSITVAKKTLSVTGPSRIVTYGDPIPSLTPSVSGFVNSENVDDLDTAPTCSTTYTNQTHASSTPVTISCQNNGVSANYSFNYNNGSITVNKKILTVSAPNPVVTYGDPVPTLTPTFAGWVNNENSSHLTNTPTCVSTYSLSSSAGTYPSVTCSGANSGNYSFLYNTGAFTINKANQTLNFNPVSVPTLQPGGSHSLIANSTSGLTPAVTTSGECSYNPSSNEITANISITSATVTCTVTASIGSSTNFNPATSISQTFNITGPAKIVRTLNAALSPAVSTTTIDAQISLIPALSPNQGTLSFTSNTTGVCAINQTTGVITLLSVGTCSVEVEAEEDSTYTSVHAGPYSFQVTSGNRTLTLTATPTSLNVGQTSTLSTNLTRGGGNITYIMTSGSNVCSISNNRITATQQGTCGVYAFVGSNGNFSAAMSNTVTITFNIIYVQQQTPVAPRIINVPPAPIVPTAPIPANLVPPTARSTPAPVLTLPVPKTEEPKIGSPVASGAPVRTSNSVDTVDTGKGVIPGKTGNISGNEATRSIESIKEEALSGFAPGVSTRIEIIGARTTGQFVITPGQIGDPVAIAAAIKESTDRNATDFAQITSAQPTSQPTKNQILSGPTTQDAVDVFAASDLAKPVTVGSLNLGAATNWLKVEAQVATYKPGSVVYLAVTTSPIIFGSAVVGEDGKVAISGNLPLSLLEDGGHNIRLVGTRELDGVSAGSDGQIQLSDTTLNEIKKFDTGSKATIKLVGANTSGGVHQVVREIPLEKNVPWWTLWIQLVFALNALIIRLFARRWTFAARVVATAVVGGVTFLPVVAGWITSSYEVMFFGLIIGAGSIFSSWIFPTRNLRKKTD
ncbi:MBG domain-containing protein [Aurantimicrobium sp. MWH-Uga1]|uniref:MBG domain-containing protein n=1 Tax=Aurantimicrobium sp. MWH-Uga1 TaxID=2079575 RepID=UPI000DF0A293|nr:MBG domain-containing protein [Aurantimicrobium sp. MWH-Uga1]AXE54424.1 hypothetical protein AURUGA1_00725 [Aurantimicrobium sp. MWH-Uga1]